MSTSTKALAIYRPTTLPEIKELATLLAGANIVPDILRNKPKDVLAIILQAQELGMPIMGALNGGLQVIRGRVTMAAESMMALCVNHPSCEQFDLVESTDQLATYEAKRTNQKKPTRVTFTMAMAKQAQLGGDGWRKYPERMLCARAKSITAREVFPHVIKGLYSTEEVEEFEAPPVPPPPRAVAVAPEPVPGPGLMIAEPEPEPELVEAQPEEELPPFDFDAPTEDPPPRQEVLPIAADVAMFDMHSKRIERATCLAELTAVGAGIAQVRGLSPECRVKLRQAYKQRSEQLLVEEE